jgi:hypothetical protein
MTLLNLGLSETLESSVPGHYYPVCGETVRMDPANGPFVIWLPDNPDSGCIIRFQIKTVQWVSVTLRTLGSDTFQDPLTGQLLTSATDIFANESFAVMYDASLLQWFTISSHVTPLEPTVFYLAAPLSVDGITPINLTYLAGDSTAWTISTNRITANRDLNVVDFSYYALVEATALANNQEADIRIAGTFTSSGTTIAIPIEWPFQSSRTGTFNASLNSSAITSQMSSGDWVEWDANGQGDMLESVNTFLLTVTPARA